MVTAVGITASSKPLSLTGSCIVMYVHLQNVGIYVWPAIESIDDVSFRSANRRIILSQCIVRADNHLFFKV